MTPIRARSASGAPAGSVPSTRTSPASAVRKPSQISTVVVLPAPLGPSRASTEPAASSGPGRSTAVDGLARGEHRAGGQLQVEPVHRGGPAVALDQALHG